MDNIRPKVAMNQISPLKVLQERQCLEIVEAALRVLERTGCEVKSAEALAILKSAGARVDGTRARVPACVVEKALRSAPKQITIYDTEGNPRIHLSARNSKTYFSSSPGATNIVDRHTNTSRYGLYSDVYEAGLVAA